eukprot:1161668-Pelagomonas_calceolata.AAC.14
MEGYHQPLWGACLHPNIQLRGVGGPALQAKKLDEVSCPRFSGAGQPFEHYLLCFKGKASLGYLASGMAPKNALSLVLRSLLAPALLWERCCQRLPSAVTCL